MHHYITKTKQIKSPYCHAVRGKRFITHRISDILTKSGKMETIVVIRMKNQLVREMSEEEFKLAAPKLYAKLKARQNPSNKSEYIFILQSYI